MTSFDMDAQEDDLPRGPDLESRSIQVRNSGDRTVFPVNSCFGCERCDAALPSDQ